MLPIYEIYKEADATLYCISDGYPKPQIRWTYTPCYNYTCDYNQTKSYSVILDSFLIILWRAVIFWGVQLDSLPVFEFMSIAFGYLA